MRVSPALLACCSLVAMVTPLLWSIAGLPSHAAESSEATSVTNALESTPLAAAAVEATTTSASVGEVATPSLQRLEPTVEQQLAPKVSLSRLLEGTASSAAISVPTATNVAPTEIAQVQTAPVGNPVLPTPPAEQDLPTPDIEIPVDEEGLGEVDINDATEDETPSDGQIDIEIEETAPPVPNNGIPVPEDEAADEAVPSAPANALPGSTDRHRSE